MPGKSVLDDLLVKRDGFSVGLTVDSQIQGETATAIIRVPGISPKIPTILRQVLEEPQGQIDNHNLGKS
jgi:hypothetical protein